MEIHRRSFDQISSGKVLRTREIQNDIVIFDADRPFRNTHFIDPGVKLIDRLVEIIRICDRSVILVAQADADSFSAGKIQAPF